MAQGLTQNLTEMSGYLIRLTPLTAICGRIDDKMWNPWFLTSLLNSTACYRDTLTFFSYFEHILLIIIQVSKHDFH
jgi:hypothetical protein